MIQHPEMLAALCLVNSISPKGYRPHDRSEHIDELARAIQSNRPSEVATYLRRNYFKDGNFPAGEVGEGVGPGDGTNADEKAFSYIMAGSMQARNFKSPEQEGIFKAMRDFNVGNRVGRLPFPVFLITSADDKVIRHEEARELRELVVTKDYPRDEIILQGCGHSPMVERSDLFIQALAGCLGRLNHQQTMNPSSTSVAKRLEAIDAFRNEQGYGSGSVSEVAYDKKK